MVSPANHGASGIITTLLLTFLFLFVAQGEGSGYTKPANCESLECPHYKVIHSQSEFEIRKYTPSTWMSTMAINSSSFTEATNKGFDYLFAYIGGKNTEAAKIDMTAPVKIDVHPSIGPFCNSTFVMHFYVPKKYQSDPPGSSEVYKNLWPASEGKHYVAVRRFGGNMDDGSVIAAQAAKLMESLKGTKWEKAVMAAAAERKFGYSLAGYNSPFEFVNRVNEVMFEF